MVVPSSTPLRGKKKAMRATCIPTIDLSTDRSKLSKKIVKACDKFGFFMVVNHGVPNEIIATMEKESLDFFAKPASEKILAGPANPFGYGSKNIGFHGDNGELEYIILEADPFSISERSKSISNNPNKFSCAANNYVESVKKVSCEILELVGEGLCIEDTSVFSKLLTDMNSDSCLRINHYPAFNNDIKALDTVSSEQPEYSSCLKGKTIRIGFGEHSDPQILTILRSNDVGGLQISSHDNGSWIPVPPHPEAFFVFVGDALQALTNGRFLSVRHRVLANANANKSRLSTMFFGAPARNVMISPPPQMVSHNNPSLYKPFTWGDYKNVVYSLHLAVDRLDFFKRDASNDITSL